MIPTSRHNRMGNNQISHLRAIIQSSNRSMGSHRNSMDSLSNMDRNHSNMGSRNNSMGSRSMVRSNNMGNRSMVHNNNMGSNSMVFQGNFKQALQYNKLVVLVLPLLCYMWLRSVVRNFLLC